MRIALFTDTFIPQVNGVANTVFRTAEGLTELGHTVCVVTISKHKSRHLENFAGGKIEVFTLPSVSAVIYKGERVSLPLGLSLRRMRKFRPDIVHTHTPFAVGLEAIRCAKKLKVPLVGTHHTFFDHYLKHIYLDCKWAKKFSWKYTVWYYNNCAKVLSPTVSLADGLKQNGLQKEIEIAPNPVDTETFRPASDKKFGEKNLVYMGRLSYEKNIGEVIKTAALVAKEMPDTKLFIIGDGPEKENLQKLAKKLGLQKNVIFTGFIFGDKLVKTLQAGDIFVSASKSENMPLAVLEAMAVGLPIVCVSSLGMQEIVRDGENGFLLPPDNPPEMAEKILELLQDEKTLESFSEKSRQMSLEYSDKKSAEKLLGIYKKLI
jgi:glycosyltransferase involved in cell wall biosynthesis